MAHFEGGFAVLLVIFTSFPAEPCSPMTKGAKCHKHALLLFLRKHSYKQQQKKKGHTGFLVDLCSMSCAKARKDCTADRLEHKSRGNKM